MYSSFFGFKENPFSLTPDPKYLFLSRYHKEALDHLLYGINERKGFIAITGGIGTGKTTLCRAFLSHLEPTTKSALIFNSYLSDRELLKAINQEFGIEMVDNAESKKDYIDALNQFLLENFSTGGNAILLIDEAQHLSHSVLEQIRMLSNLETEKEKLIQIILVGQPELKGLLISPALKQLDERITVRYDLKPLDSKDIKGYIDHRLVVAGSRGGPQFTRGALKKVFKYSLGNPRRINAVCDRSLLIAYARETLTISERMVSKAIEEVRGDMTADPRVRDLSRRWLILTASLTILLITVSTFAGWTYRKEISRLFLNEQKVSNIKTRYIPRKPVMPQKKGTTLFLDEQKSLSELFRLVNETRSAGITSSEDMHLDLVSLDIGPEYYEVIEKPFRLQTPREVPSSLPFPRYLLVREQTHEWAVIIDAEGRKQTVTRDFILRNWGLKISWFFPDKNRSAKLSRDMSPQDILEVQMTLQNKGYQVELTGVFDESTFKEIVKLQKDFGLTADGIVGPMTRALLYLIS
jgi:general secretion pathway protein A